MSELTSLLFSLHWRLTHLQKILPCSRTTPPRLTRKGVNLAFEIWNLVKKRNRSAIVFQVAIYFPSTGEQKELKRQVQPPPRPEILFFHPKKFGKPYTFQNMWEFISCLKSVLYNNEWHKTTTKNLFPLRLDFTNAFCNSKVCFYVNKP